MSEDIFHSPDIIGRSLGDTWWALKSYEIFNLNVLYCCRCIVDVNVFQVSRIWRETWIPPDAVWFQQDYFVAFYGEVYIVVPN